MQTFIYELGKKAKDRVTGFTGVITGRSDFIAGCRQYCLAPPINAEGKIVDSHWFDEERIDIIGDGVSLTATKTGGPTGSERPIAR